MKFHPYLVTVVFFGVHLVGNDEDMGFSASEWITKTLQSNWLVESGGSAFQEIVHL